MEADRMLLDDLVFRLEHHRNDTWELGEECFRFYKLKPLVDQYAEYWSLRADFAPESEDSPYFARWLEQSGAQASVATLWRTDQADSHRLRELAAKYFDGPLDLIVDDCSHLYRPTSASFETLFPLLRPGGPYIVEDWAWSHWEELQGPGHPVGRRGAG